MRVEQLVGSWASGLACRWPLMAMACVVSSSAAERPSTSRRCATTARNSIIYAVLGKLRPGPRDAIYRASLSANLPTGEGVGAVIALDADRDEVILQRILDATSLNAVYLSEIVEKFVEMAVLWTERIEHFDQRVSVAGPADRDMDELAQAIYHPRA